ncbi:hypothetical protein [Mesomycoplasma hyorhinis]|uniref:hypothetical protein n=1 Tax=Mesomycoplasma hyorhinis TaxID=2100 RepID=UPI001C0453A9|nr:hypothetical protein [Mesomycoplasma hyorhinis]
MKKPIVIALSLVSTLTVSSVSVGTYFGIKENNAISSPSMKLNYDNDGIPQARLKLEKNNLDVSYVAVFKDESNNLNRKILGAHNGVLLIQDKTGNERLVEVLDMNQNSIWKADNSNGIDLSVGKLDIKNKSILLNKDISKNATINIFLQNSEGQEVKISKHADANAKVLLSDNELFSMLNLKLNKIITDNQSKTEKVKLVISNVDGIEVQKPVDFATDLTISSATINVDFVSKALSLDPSQQIEAKFKESNFNSDNAKIFSVYSVAENKDDETYGLNFRVNNLKEDTKYELVSLAFVENPYKNFDLLANVPFWTAPADSDFNFTTATKDINLELLGQKELENDKLKYKLDITFTSLPSNFYNRNLQVEYTDDQGKVVKSQPQKILEDTSRYGFNFTNLSKNTNYKLSKIFVFDKSESDVFKDIDFVKNNITDSFIYTQEISNFRVVQTNLNSVKIRFNFDDDYKTEETKSPLTISYKKVNDPNDLVKTVSAEYSSDENEGRFVETTLNNLDINTKYEIVKIQRNIPDFATNSKTLNNLVYFDIAKSKATDKPLDFMISFKLLSATPLDIKTGKFNLKVENNLDNFNNYDVSLTYSFTKQNQSTATEKIITHHETGQGDNVVYDDSTSSFNVQVPSFANESGKYTLKSLNIFAKTNKDKEKTSILATNLQTLDVKSKADFVQLVDNSIDTINKNYLPSMITKELLNATIKDEQKPLINSSLQVTSGTVDDKQGELPVTYSLTYFGSTTQQSYTIKNLNKLVEIKDTKDKYNATATSAESFFEPRFALTDDNSYFSYWYANKTEGKDIVFTINPQNLDSRLMKEFWIFARKHNEYSAEQHLTSYFTVKITYKDERGQDQTKDLTVNNPTEFTATTKTPKTTQQHQTQSNKEFTTTTETYHKWTFVLDKLTKVSKIKITFKKEYQPKYVSIFKVRFVEPEKTLPQK